MNNSKSYRNCLEDEFNASGNTDKTVSQDKLMDVPTNELKIQEFENIISECKDIVQTFTNRINLMDDSMYMLNYSAKGV
jgi:hypothetical protein